MRATTCFAHAVRVRRTAHVALLTAAAAACFVAGGAHAATPQPTDPGWELPQPHQTSDTQGS